MHSVRFPRWTLAVLLTIPAFGLGMAVSVSATASSTTTFYACLHNGRLTKVSTSTHTCKPGKLESWNAVGPGGGQGIQGIQGVQGAQGVQGNTGPSDLNALNGTPCTIDQTGHKPPITSHMGVYENPVTGAADLWCLGGQPSLFISRSVDPNGFWGGYSGSGLQPGAVGTIYLSPAASPTSFVPISTATVAPDGTSDSPGWIACGTWADEYMVSTTYSGSPITSPTVAAPC
jgi:hypothetical protein